MNNKPQNFLQRRFPFFWEQRVPILAGLMSAFISVLATLVFMLPRFWTHPPASRAFTIEEMIEEGDRAFYYDYGVALRAYESAQAQLLEEIVFESGAPAKDARLLQHYHNVKALLEARIEVTLIAQKIKRMKSSQSSPSPTRMPLMR